MTTYVGEYLPTAIWPTVAPDSPGARTWATDASDHSPYVRDSTFFAGTKTYGDAGISPAGVSLTGFRFQSFIDDYYYRIHVIPSAVALGNLVSQVDQSISIWNAYLNSINMTSVSSSSAIGLTILGLPALPFLMKPLQYNTYTLRATTVGPPIIEGQFLFGFSTGASLPLTVTGRRILVFPFPPNWAAPVAEILEWKTDILPAYDGTEQRRALLVIPRRGFEYSVLLKGFDTQLLENLLWGWQYRQFAFPVWTDKAKLTADVAAGAIVLPMVTTNLSFVVGQLGVLYAGSTSFEAGVIAGVTGSTVTFQYPLQQTWPLGTRVYPAVIGQLPTTVPTQRHTDNALEAKVAITTSPDKTDPFLADTAAPVTYDGLEVITRQPNWGSAINNDIIHGFETIDAGTGPIAWLRTETAGKTARPYGWLLRDRAQIVAFRQLMQRLRGQAKTVWIPSWHNDMTVVAITALGGSSLTIAGTEFANLIGVDTARDRIMVRVVTGEIYYRRVTTVTLSGNTSVLGVDTPFPIQLTPTNVKRVHLLLRCRLATDKVEIPWRTDSVADPQLAFVTVPQ